jgi:tape measure domain-containing protein
VALRELFATFTFSWDRGTLAAVSAATKRAEAGVQQLARGFDRAAGRASAARGPMSAWGRLAQQAGVGAAAFGGAVRGLRGNLDAAAQGDARLVAATRELGIDLARVTRAGYSTSAAWGEVAGRLSRVGDESKRARLALALLGDTGAQVVLPAVGGGSSGLRTALRGAAVPTAAPAAAAEIGTIARLRTAWRRLRAEQVAGAGAARKARIAEADGIGKASDGLTWYERRLRSVREQSRRGIVGSMLHAAFWTGLAYSILRTGRALVSFGERMAGALVGKAFEASTWAESVRKGLGMISGLGEQKGGAEFEQARAAALEYGLALQPTIDTYKRLRAVGFSADKALSLTRLTADLKAGLGMTDETVGRIQLALAQIKGAGVLQGDELRQLQETGISIDRVWESIAKQLGVSVKEARKLKEAGKVTADVAIRAVEDATFVTLGTKAPGEAAAKLAGATMRGGLGKAKAAWDSWLLDLGQTLEPTFNSLARTIGGMFARFQSDGTLEATTRAITRLLQDFLDLVEIHWPRVEQIIRRGALGGADALGGLTSSLDGMIDGFLTAVEWIQDNWPKIKETISDACTIAKYAIEAIFAAKIISGLATVVSGIAQIGSAAKSAAGLVRTLVQAIAEKNAAESAPGTATAAKGVTKTAGKFAPLAAGAGALAAGAVVGAIGGAAEARNQAQMQDIARRQGLMIQPGMPGMMPSMVSMPSTARLASPEIARTYEPRLSTPVIRGGARAVTLTDRRTTTINVTGAGTPAATGRAVEGAVSRQQGVDLGQLQGALVGAAE